MDATNHLPVKNIGPKEGRFGTRKRTLGTFTTDAPEVNVLWHDGHTLGVDGAEVGIFEETDQVSFGCFLQGHNCRRLEVEIT